MLKRLSEIEKYGRSEGVPILQYDSACVLANIVEELKPKTVLEIGTAIGYSSLIILLSADCTLTTLEIDEGREKIAKDNFATFNVVDRVEPLLMDAMEYLKTCNKKFDFVFLDGPKGQYIKYLPYIKNCLNSGAVLLCDNVLFRGLVKSEDKIPHRYRTLVVNLRKFIDTVSKDNDFECNVYDICDGLLVAKYIK